MKLGLLNSDSSVFHTGGGGGSRGTFVVVLGEW
jgi:hypothetical protein